MGLSIFMHFRKVQVSDAHFTQKLHHSLSSIDAIVRRCSSITFYSFSTLPPHAIDALLWPYRRITTIVLYFIPSNAVCASHELFLHWYIWLLSLIHAAFLCFAREWRERMLILLTILNVLILIKLINSLVLDHVIGKVLLNWCGHFSITGLIVTTTQTMLYLFEQEA